MSKKETRITGNLIATDQNGKQYRITEYTDFVETTEFGNTTRSWAPTLKAYRLNDGSWLTETSPTEFEIVNSGVRIRV